MNTGNISLVLISLLVGLACLAPAQENNVSISAASVEETTDTSVRTTTLKNPRVVTCQECPNYDESLTMSSSWQTTSSQVLPEGCHMYRVWLTQGNSYTFQTGCGEGATADFDTMMVLYSPSCNTAAGDDDGCAPNLSRILLPTFGLATGYYYLKVFGYMGAGGNFTMAWREVSAPTSTPIISPSPTCPLEDLNNDCKVDQRDLFRLLKAWHIDNSN